jgi:predicted enzyme related to lactoylglutathione lyase
MSKKVTGIGGIFFKSKDPAATKEWYKRFLGIESGEHGHTFWNDVADYSQERTSLSWSIFKKEASYFKPGDQDFMINYRVQDLDAIVSDFDNAGILPVGDIEEFEYGKFAWFIDPDGRKIELWQPKNEQLFE